MDEAILLEKPLGKLTRFLYRFAIAVFICALFIFAVQPKIAHWFSLNTTQLPSIPTKQPIDAHQTAPTVGVFQNRMLKETFFLPELVNFIHCYQRPARPDRVEKGRYFSFINEPFFFLEQGSQCFLALTSQGFEQSTKETPLQLRLSEDGQSAELLLQIVTSDNVILLEVNHVFPISDFPNVVGNAKSKEFADFCKKIESLALYSPDIFFKLYGGKEYREKGQNFRLGNLASQVYPIERGAIFTLQYNALVPLIKPINAKCPLFRIQSISSNRVEVEAWDATGREYVSIPLYPQNNQTFNVKPEEFFKDIRIRGRERALVKIGKKTKILRSGDYLFRVGKSWKLIDEKDELERLLNYLNYGILFVFEGVFQKGKEVVFTGRLFDETRSIQKKVELPVKLRKKQKPPRNRSIEKPQTNAEEVPQEIEELLEELDDL